MFAVAWPLCRLLVAFRTAGLPFQDVIDWFNIIRFGQGRLLYLDIHQGNLFVVVGLRLGRKEASVGQVAAEQASSVWDVVNRRLRGPPIPTVGEFAYLFLKVKPTDAPPDAIEVDLAGNLNDKPLRC